MRYQKVIPAIFISRPNRFIACVEVDGREEIAHVKNTGRCKELLVPGCRVHLAVSDNPARKTKFDLVAVEKRREDGDAFLINMDSQIVNDVAEEWLKEGALVSPTAKICREKTFGSSRFDFYVEDGTRKIFLEVKGVTLEQDGAVSFPDAPTERGVKHVKELMACLESGYEAYILFIIQMEGPRAFSPNDKTHPAFGDALRKASQSGVKILALDCFVTENSISVHGEIPVVL